MSNINFFRVLQNFTSTGAVDNPINFDFSCNNSTTVNLTDFSGTYSSSANFRVYAANSNTYSNGNDGSYLYASKYSGADDPDQMIQMFEYNYDSNDNLGFPKLDDMTDDVEGDGTKIFRIDNSDTITGGFPDGGENIFGFKQDIVVARTNNFTNSPTTLVVNAYRFVGGINYTKIYQFAMNTAWDISSVNTGSINHITVANDYNGYSAPVPTNNGMCFNNDGSKLFIYQTGRRAASNPNVQHNRWLTIIPLTTNYDLSTYSSSTTSSINLNSTLGFDPKFFNTTMQVFYTCTNADGSYNYNCSSSTLRDVIRIYSGSSGGVDNEVYFEIDSNNSIANVSSSYNGSTQGASYRSTSNAYTFKSTASAAGTTTFGLQYNNELVFTGGATSLTQCEFTTHPTVIL